MELGSFIWNYEGKGLRKGVLCEGWGSLSGWSFFRGSAVEGVVEMLVTFHSSL